MLSNGRMKRYPTQENDEWKFYSCGTHQEAVELQEALQNRSKKAVVDFSSYGWFVRLKK